MDSNSKQNILAGLVGTSPIGGRLDANGNTNSACSSSLGAGGGTATPGAAGRQHKLKQRFTVIRKLGKGTYGKVQLAINKSTGQEVAIKTIKKSKIESPQDLERVRREIQIMSSIEHPHIIHIYEVFENKDKIVLVMQYAPGGELYEYVSERKVLEESEARRLFRQIATAIYYCHKNKICHRDLKLENILLDEKNNAKIADFGLSNVFDKRRQLKTFCGSPLYASPEIVQGSPYEGPEVDCWSLGVLLYTLVYGAMPFEGSNLKRLVKQISESAYLEPKQKSQASPLIGKLLCVNPNKRATIVDVCSDAWVNGLSLPASPSSAQSPSTLPSTSLLQVAQDMANLTPVRFDILLALAPPDSPPPPPAAAAERPPLARPLASQSNILNVAQKKLAIMELEEPGDVGVDEPSPVASYIVRDLTTEKMDDEKENEEPAAREPPQAAPGDDPRMPVEDEEPMEVEQAEEGEAAGQAEVVVEVLRALPEGEEEKTETRVEEEEEEEPVARMEVELAQSPQRPPEESTQPEVKQHHEDTESKVDTSSAAEVPAEAEPQKDAEAGEQRPVKKVKKKIVVVKKKKRVSTKKNAAEGEAAASSVAAASPGDESKGDKSRTDKSADERTSSTSTSISTGTGGGSKRPQQQVGGGGGGEKVGKVKIPETFSGGESPPVPGKGSLETRRQSALVADVAQKLLLAAQGGPASANSELKDDMPSLASVRVAETKVEFERRASLAAAAAASQAREAARGDGGSQAEPERLEDAKTLRELLDILDQSAVLEPVRAAPPREAEMLVTKEAVKSADERSDSVETVKPQEQLETMGASHEDAQPLKMAPITRSYKKVTFTRDGACITETGRIYSTRGEDGTLRRVERKSKVTHFPSSGHDGGGGLQEEEEEEVTSYGDGQDLLQPPEEWQASASRPFEKLIMPSSSLFDDDDLAPRHATASAMSHRRPSPRACGFKRADSRSSCSSGSTDAFDDIFDTWTGAISMFSNTNWPAPTNLNSHNNFRPLSSLFGAAGRRRHHHSTSDSPRCASADVGAGPSWPHQQAPRDGRQQQQQQPGRPRSGWSPHSSGYDSDAPLDRPASAAGGAGRSARRPRSSLFGSSQQLQSLFQQPSSSSLGAAAMSQAQPGDLTRSLAAEHEQMKRRLDRQHRQLWKGSTASLFEDHFNDNANLDDDLALLSPLPDLFGPSSRSQREKSPAVAGRPPRPSNSPGQQHLVEQSQSSSSFTSRQLRHSLALDSAPRRSHQQQQQAQVERSSSAITSQLANLRLSSSTTGDSLPSNSPITVTKPATFIQLKRTSSIKRMETQLQQRHHEQIKPKSNTGSIRSTAFFELGSLPSQAAPEVARPRQVEVEDKRAAEERVQHWLQDNSDANTSSAGNLSQSSASKTTSSASLQSAATSQNNSNPAAASQFNKHSVTSFATSSSSRRHVESQQQQQQQQQESHQFAKTVSKQEVFSVREQFKMLQGDGSLGTAPVARSETRQSDERLEWISQAQNDLLNSMATVDSQHQEEGASCSLLEQLRSRGYRSLINRRMVAGEQQVSSSSSSLVNGEMVAQQRSQQIQVQKQHVSSSSSSSSGAGSGAQRLQQQQQQHHFTSSLATQLRLDEDQQEDFQQQQELKVASEAQEHSVAAGEAAAAAAAANKEEEDEDEDVREAKSNIRAYVERMRETELFLKSLQQVEEEQARRQREQSFLFDNLMLSASRFLGTGSGAKQQPLSYIALPAEGRDIEWQCAARGSRSAPIKPATSANLLANGYIKPLPTAQAHWSPGSPPASHLGGPFRARTVGPLEPVQPVQARALLAAHFDAAPVVQRQHFRRSKSQLGDPIAQRSPLLSRADLSQSWMEPGRPLSMRLAREEPPPVAARSRRSLSQVRWPSAWSGPSSAATSEYRSAYCGAHQAPTNGAGDEDEEGMSEYRVSSYVPKVVPQGPPPPLRQTRAERVGRGQQRGQRAPSPRLERGPDEQAPDSGRRGSARQAGLSPAPAVGHSETTRRLGPTNLQDSAPSSRLTELEQRIQANKRRRQQLLAGDSPSTNNRDNKDGAETDQGGEGPSTGDRQPIRRTNRPSRLESMEARIKRRSYCVQVAGECSPERRPAARRGSFLL